MKVILTIAGSDSSAGAGIQADIKSISANGGFATTALTAVTAQNTVGVQAVELLSPELVTAQIDSVFADLPVAAIKTGMLGSAETIDAVVDAVERHRPEFFVLDPVICAAGGDLLMDQDGIQAIVTRLMPLATVVTPNIYEARAMAGVEVETLQDVEKAAQRIVAMGARAVVVTGGALEDGPATDVMVVGDTVEHFNVEFVDSANTHGTGCTFSAAIATRLAQGASLRKAVEDAKHFTTEAIRHGPAFGAGHRPTDHFFMLRSSQQSTGD